MDSRYRRALGLIAAGWILRAAIPAAADVASDRASAILVFPRIVSERTTVVASVERTVVASDTIVQISNTSSSPVALRCFYISGNNHCSASAVACDPDAAQPCPSANDLCLPSWVETDFKVFLTPRQPLAWKASSGLDADDLPLAGPGGGGNDGTRVPAVAMEPFFSAAAEAFAKTDSLENESFVGELKCVVVDDSNRAVARNVVKGEATIVTSYATGNDVGDGTVVPSVEKYNAIGIQAIEGDANGDNHLELGGGTNEYNGCPSIIIADHFFDFAIDPAASAEVFAPDAVFSDLTLVSCTQDYRNQVPGGAVAQFLVFNEFEQRFSTSRPMQCIFDKPLSRIDTSDPRRSIFSDFVSGTLTGQTRIRAVGNGFVGILRERRGKPFLGRFAFKTADINLQQQGEREGQDRLGLTFP